MPAPTTIDEFLDLVRKSGVVDPALLEEYLARQAGQSALPRDLGKFAGRLVRDGVITHFQAEQILRGKWRRFHIGKYRVLERIGSGGMGSVYLCEHMHMARRVAVKVLPSAKAEDQAALERFYREARAVAALDHPNLVRAYDIDQDGEMHFLVMEYIDGTNLQDIIKRHGPLDVMRAAHYMRQAAQGLQYAHQAAGLVHRDIKPGNILLDRTGVIKVLDLGLARFFHDEDEVITKKYDENVLGTADYLAPEQALDSHAVDVRADIYSLGGTFYFCLTGSTPFSQGTAAQKLIWHQTRRPTPVRELRPEVPEGMEAVIDRMMAKEPAARYQTPAEVADALVTWTQLPIAPPPEHEMPRLCPAAAGATGVPDGRVAQSGPSSSGASSTRRVPTSPGSSTVRPLAAFPPPSRPPLTPAAQPRSRAAKSGSGSAAAKARPAPAVKVARRVVELSPVAWQNSEAPDTAEAVAQVDTVRETVRKATKKARRLTVRARRWPRYSWVIAAAVPAAVILLCTLYASLSSNRAGAVNPSEIKKANVPAFASTTWRVSASNRADALPTVLEALLRAKPGDHIAILDDRIEERLSLNGQTTNNITIESGVPGRLVHWVCPRLRGSLKFVSIADVEGLHLRGIDFDAAGRAEVATISGRCPRLVMEDMELRGFTRAGAVMSNCTAEVGPGALVMRRVRIRTEQPCDAAIMIAGAAPGERALCQNILIENGRFDGPFRSAVKIASGATGVRITGSRFFGMADAFFFEGTNQRWQLQLTVDSNTFCEIGQSALHLQALPADDRTSQVLVKNNLFARTTLLAQLDEVDRLADSAALLTAAYNVRDEQSQEGNLGLQAKAMAVELPTDADDGAFLRYPPDSGLTRAGANRLPVGAGPATGSGAFRSAPSQGPDRRNLGDNARTDM
jgi:serine/threonine protein kinase